MPSQHATVPELRRALIAEVLRATGLQDKALLRVPITPLIWPPAHRCSRIAAEFDRLVAQSGLMAAARWVLPRFVDDVHVLGAEQVPTRGPLVVASNHPGGYDALVVASCLPRDDLKVVITGRDVFRALVGTSPHLIYTPPPESPDRMMVIREAVRHLRGGGALLIFAAGQVEPDPAVLPGAEESLQRWSPSLPLLLRSVPGVSLLVSMVSGVLAPACLRHPLTRLAREKDLKQLLAEGVQLSQQLLFNRRFGLTPTVRFAAPLTGEELDRGRDVQATLAAVIARAKGLLPASVVDPSPESLPL